MNSVKEECKQRLEILKQQGLITDMDVVGLFENDRLCISEANMMLGQPCGIIFELSDKSEYNNVFKEKITSSLNKSGATPYFLMAQNTSLGLLVSVLYVSEYVEQWEMERDDLENQNPCAYVYNIDEGFCEVSYIRYKMLNGGPIRIA